MYTISPCGGDPKHPSYGIFDPDRNLVGGKVYSTPEEAEARLAELVFDHEERKPTQEASDD